MTFRPMDATLAADGNSERFRELYRNFSYVGCKLYGSVLSCIQRVSGISVASIHQRLTPSSIIFTTH